MNLYLPWTSRKRRISEGEELTKGRNVQLPAAHVCSQCGARGVRGAVFRDIALKIDHEPSGRSTFNQTPDNNVYHKQTNTIT